MSQYQDHRKSALLSGFFLLLGSGCLLWGYRSWKDSSELSRIGQVTERKIEAPKVAGVPKRKPAAADDVLSAAGGRILKSLQFLDLQGPFKVGDRVHWSLTAGPGELQAGAAFWLEGETKITKEQSLLLALRKYKLVAGRYHLDWATDSEKQSEVLLIGGFLVSEQKNIRKRIAYIQQQERKRFLKVIEQFEFAPQAKWKKIFASTHEFSDVEKKKGKLSLRAEWQKLRPLVEPERLPSSTDSTLSRLKVLKKDFLFSKVN